MMAFFLSMIRKKKFFVLYTPWCLLSSYKLDTNILSLISNMMLFWRRWAWQILYKQLNTMVDMFCLEWISHHISHLGFCLQYCYEKSNFTKQINNNMYLFIYFCWYKFNWYLIDLDILCFNATFSNISAISWRPVLVVEEDEVPGENHRPWASNW